MSDAKGAGEDVPVVTFQKGEEILVQNQVAEHLYILMDGTVSLWRNGKRLRELRARNVLGAEGIYNASGALPCTVRAETLCRATRFTANAMRERLLSVPRLAELLVSCLAVQLSNAWLQIDQSLVSREQELHFAGDIQTFEPGQTIIREGDTNTLIYRIISSDAGVEVIKGDTVLASLSDPGEFFGEMASLLKEPRTASVRSVGRTVLEVYPEEQLREILKDYPELSLRILTSLVRRLAETSQALSDQ
ncbi:MAG TPA: cyclic nucleotide-binding domain-containing protein [Desulfomicrobiaceae bacterium]|nr:cyclic nucleotide-binding domain-containing protein [Desulfomicrobiaceae bacterium]